VDTVPASERDFLFLAVEIFFGPVSGAKDLKGCF
jgi:hypothetical protein